MRSPKRSRRFHLAVSLAVGFSFCPVSLASAQVTNGSGEVITIDGKAEVHPFPHFWEQMFGSGRASLALRQSYRDDLRETKAITDFQYVRFHAILHDEVGVYSEDAQGKPSYNFSYVDQIYDGLLANGVKPFVELSFMPNDLAAHPTFQAFWYKPDVSPPKDWPKWDDLMTAFVTHLVDRYGIDEVASWFFEVWNEPNLDFWAGDPRQESYFLLYDHTARDVKKVNARLRVGGPATAQAAWVDAFIKHCADNNVPVDFVSTHVYGNDSAKDVFGTDETIPREKMVCRAVKKVHDQIQASTMPKLPLIWSEFNASYKNETDITDSTYMGPWLADTIRQCDGLVDMMSYWTFSDVFEEQGVVKTPFYGGYGLIAERGIPKPAFNAFEMLHHLGDQRLAVDSDSAVFTREKDGSYALAIWSYARGDQGRRRPLTINLKNLESRKAVVWRLDDDHGNVLRANAKMGSPRYPTQAQIEELRHAAQLPEWKSYEIKNHQLNLDVSGNSLLLVELK
ncbi:MAG: GH39 family glycosyl hydrolase [Candidatus Sulfotelmatobacter sp.]